MFAAALKRTLARPSGVTSSTKVAPISLAARTICSRELEELNLTRS